MPQLNWIYMHKPLIRIALLVCALASLVFAQSEIGGATLNGTVTDPSGAAIPNAKVTITNTATGVTRTLNTNEAGLFKFTPLPLRTHDMTVEAGGVTTDKNTRR